MSAALDALRLDGRAAIVTGASRGLGRAMALALAGAGADVALASRSVAELEETARAIEKLGRRALVVPTDVTVYSQVEALVERTAQTLGRLDIVVNNSGIAAVIPAAEMPPEDFRRTVEVNLVGVFNGCRAAAGRLIAQKSGKIINLASVLGASGLAGYAAYSASKGGVIALTRALAVEWARYNIQVNAMAPGWFVTDMNSQAFDDPKVRERLLRDVPARRTGRLEEIGPLVVYLASPGSDYMTGQTVFLDGGHSAA
ncbi:MAG TPA: SDR family NAD(P)-dependent oxidoreductase [Methylomirabilota bacterium]|nr:SDR family NAD(P)-dependent oxidoreductase [Methylomirabilota bacterium]